jgi:hypothetical protein
MDIFRVFWAKNLSLYVRTAEFTGVGYNIKRVLNSQPLIRDIKISTSFGIAQIAENESLHSPLLRTSTKPSSTKSLSRNIVSFKQLTHYSLHAVTSIH